MGKRDLGGARGGGLLGLLGALLAGCGLLAPGAPAERWSAELAETALAVFLMTRHDPLLPAGPLAAQGASVYGAVVDEAGGATRVWQVRYPRAEVVSLPVAGREREAGVQFKADVVILFEQRYCTATREAGSWRCEPWQLARCCEQVWRLTRDGWASERPPARQ
jgi:hypothetical protein